MINLTGLRQGFASNKVEAARKQHRKHSKTAKKPPAK
jgi:hypothetical protein